MSEDRITLLRTPIIRAVAEPMRIFLVPTPLFGLNLCLCMVIAIFVVSILQYSPWPAFFAVPIFHGIAAWASAKDMHIVNVLRATKKPSLRSRNLTPSKTIKYVP